MAVVLLRHYVPAKDKEEQPLEIYEKTWSLLQEIALASKKRFLASGVDLVIDQKEFSRDDLTKNNGITIECPDLGIKETLLSEMDNSEVSNINDSLIPCPSRENLQGILQDLLFQVIDLAGNEDESCSGG